MNTRTNSQCQIGSRGWLFSPRVLGLLCGTALMSAAVLVFPSASSAQSSDQSLADVARHNKPVRKAARVITNDDIPSAPTAPEPSPKAVGPDSPQTSPATNASRAPEAKPSGSEGKSSKSGVTVPGLLTNGTLQQAQTLLENAKHDRQALTDNYDKIRRKLAETNDESLRRVYADSLARRDQSLAKQDKVIAEIESAIRAAQGANAEGDQK